ncbi:glycosyltransferase [Granulosicoccaceae sp. 1_MG-2023]|nr:glycosyltransferase [Granulosicoccaceae sp. 1_MG-2023]
MKLALYIASLETGGAEQQMVRLANSLARRGHEVSLISCFGGPLEAKVDTGAGVRLDVFKPGFRQSGLWRFLFQGWAVFLLARRLRRGRPECVLSALYASNAVLYCATRLLRNKPALIWSIRTTAPKQKALIRFWYTLCRRVSPRVDLLLANSTPGLQFHLQDGFRPRRHALMPNLIDQPEMPPRAPRSPGAPLRIGLVGRIDRTKNLACALRAYAQACVQADLAPLTITGPVSDKGYQEELLALCESLGISENVHWQGHRADLLPVYATLDVLLNSSDTEGFSNVIAEAMACDVRCVVSDVGDSAQIVGEAGCVFPAGDDAAAARALVRIALDDVVFTISPRRRIADHFDPEVILGRFEEAVRTVL